MERISRDGMLLVIAETVALRSTCSRKHVGAVVARDGRVLVTGYNGAPAGMTHCYHRPEDPPCTVSVHAEANCIAYAARYGINLQDSTIYTTLTPCLSCAQLIINAGITRVVCKENYRDDSGIRLLKRAGLEVKI